MAVKLFGEKIDFKELNKNKKSLPCLCILCQHILAFMNHMKMNENKPMLMTFSPL